MATSLPLGPIQVNTSHYLKVFLSTQRCRCGGYFKPREQRTHRVAGARIRKILAVCSLCRAPRMFEFDITGTRPEPEDRQRFLRTVSAFLDGMQALKDMDYHRAEKRFLEAIDEEQGEPNFTVAHYQLGRIALKTARYQEALRRFRRAALLQPLEIHYHRALLAAYQATGRTDDALAEMAHIEDLKLRLGLAGAAYAEGGDPDFL